MLYISGKGGLSKIIWQLQFDQFQLIICCCGTLLKNEKQTLGLISKLCSKIEFRNYLVSKKFQLSKILQFFSLK